MTTVEIETEADRSGLSTGDMDLKFLLRRKIVPEFFQKVGYVSWRRKMVTSQSLTAGQSSFDISTDDFGHMRWVCIGDAFDQPLTYIGDEERKVLKAKLNTTRGRPSEFFIESTGTSFRRIVVNCPADQTYVLPYSYDIHIPWADNSTSVDLDIFIPREFQFALVIGLQREIAENRYGLKDSRFQTKAQEFETWVALTAENPEKSKGGKVAYAN